MDGMSDFLKCNQCNHLTNVKKDDVPKIEWDKWKCSDCDGTFYGQEFIHWIADRISPSTSEDSTGRFVLRELVQNADDVQADSIIFKFCEDALYVYNNGFGFRSDIGDGPGDFDRISRVLAKPKEKEYYTSGNFGSGFQTVYLFTNYPEVHSHGKSFRYDPTIPQKISLNDNEKISSPYRKNEEKKGVVFRFPWRTDENAIVKKNNKEIFTDKQIWKRWNAKSRILLFDELKEYLHDSILCCQHLKKIRILWKIDSERVDYQVERDFTLNYIENDGKRGNVKEGIGEGGLQSDEWQYKASKEFSYLIASGFVHDINRKVHSIYTILEDGDGHLKVSLDIDLKFDSSLSKVDYFTFLGKKGAVKKSDVHILIPLFPWEKRAPGYGRKAWSYSVVPLPKESGNNFTLSAHLFPKQTREDFELHQEKAKRDWLEKVLLSAAKIFMDIHSRYIDIIKSMDLDNHTKQKILLDYLPEPKLGRWINVSLDDDDVEAKIEEDFFIQLLSKKILLYKGNWYNPFRLDSKKKGFDSLIENVAFPRDENEMWLLERMPTVTITEEFQNHQRFKELNEFNNNLKNRILMNDEKFNKIYRKFQKSLEEKGEFVYGQGHLDIDFVDKLIDHCLLTNGTEDMKSISILPNRNGDMLRPSDLKREPDGYSILREIIPSNLHPHLDFDKKVRKYIEQIKNPEDLLDGIKENKEVLEENNDLLIKCYEWLDKSRVSLPEDIEKYPIVLNSNGHLVSKNDVFLVPINHHDFISGYLTNLDAEEKIVSKSILSTFNDFILKKLEVKMFDYSKILDICTSKIEGNTDEKKEFQLILVEGILLGIEKGTWNINDENDLEKLTYLHFLPVDGALKCPPETCLGSVNDKEVDNFLGSIDGHVQDIIKSNENFVDSLSELKAGNMDEDHVGWLVDRIDTFADKHADKIGLCHLDEEHHRIISKCLTILIQKPNQRQNTSIMDKKILPVEYQGSISLCTLPRWDQKSSDRRLEYYERDWPWVKPNADRLFPDAKAIWNSIRFINLHKDFKDTENELIKIFNLERLIARDGVPRALTMYFLLPRDEPEKCLFNDDFIKNFVQTELSKDDLENIKKSLLLYLRSYYKEINHKEENKINRKDKKCLYGTDGIWRIPSEFAFNMDDDLEIIGYHKLHDFFSEDDGWTRKTLVNLGVVDRVGFENIEKSIKSISNYKRNPECDRRILKILIMIIEDELGLSEDWKRLSDIEWVPTIDGNWREPRDTLSSLVELEQIFKFDAINSIIDLSSLTNQEKIKILNFKKEQFEHIGFRTYPRFEEFIEVWDYCERENIPPPLKFFDELDNNFNEWKDLFIDESRDRKYFCDGKWVLPSKVVMDQIEKIPESLRDVFSFTNEHENILSWLRGGTDNDTLSIKVRDALEIFEGLNLDDKKIIWNFVVERRAEIDNLLLDDFKDKQIFPYLDEIYAPKNIIIPSRGEKNLKFRGKLNDFYILENELSRDDIDTLLKLGASEIINVLNDLQKSYYLLLQVTKEKPMPGTDLWSDFITLISIFMEEDAELSSNLNIIPVENGPEIYYELPKRIVIKDEQGIWNLFKDEQRLKFFDPKIFSKDNIDVEQVVKWFKNCGANDINTLLESKEPNRTSAEYRPDITNIYKKLFKNLCEIVKDRYPIEDQIEIIGPIENLLGDDQSGFSVYSCEDIIREYCFDMTSIDGGTPILIKVDDNYYFDSLTSTFFILNGIENPIELLKEKIKVDFNPGFYDIYRMTFWENAVESAFNEDYGFISSKTIYISGTPNLRSNLEILDRWWGDYSASNDKSSFPTLDGNFWWPALGLDDSGDENNRVSLLEEHLFSDRKLMFNIFSMATLLGANVGRMQIKNYISLLDSKGLSFSEIYDMEEEVAIKEMIDDIFNINHESLQEKHYPDLRRRFFDILLLRRALKDEYIGKDIMGMLKALIDDGLSPEYFLTSGQEGGIKPSMKGFKGMFTGQIYFIIREAVRLGLADKWDPIAFHAPSQVRKLIENLGGDMSSTSRDGRREDLAKMMIGEINAYDNLKIWYDIPFFIYYDEFCRNCKRGNNNSYRTCEMQCRESGDEW